MCTFHCATNDVHVLYNRKYWRELNLAVGPQIAIAKILADLNLAGWYHAYTCICKYEILADFLIWQLRDRLQNH